MRRLDRYVLGLFVGSYATAFLLVVGLFFILSLAVNLDEYLRPWEDGTTASWLEVGELYVLSIPFLYLEVAPFVTLLAGLFTLAKLMRHNEVVATLAAGVSSQRLLAPVLVSGGLLAVGMLVLREEYTERIGPRRDALTERLTYQRVVPEYEDLWLHDANGMPVRIDFFLDGASPTFELMEATDMAGERWMDFSAVAGAWDAAADPPAWRLEGGLRQDLTARDQPPVPMAVLEEVEFTPSDVRLAHKGKWRPMDLSFGEARRLAERNPFDLRWQTLLQVQLTFPMGHLVLLLVGLPLLLRHTASRGEGVVAGFLLCVLYYGADFLFRSLGMQGVLSPLLAAWMPVLAFGSLGVVLFGSMRS